MTPAASDDDDSGADPEGVPFTFQAGGRVIPIPGAWQYPEGVYIPIESLAILTEHLSDRRGLERRLAQLEQKLRDADPARDHEVLKARALTYRLSRLMDQGPEAMAEWLDNLTYNRPLLEARVEGDALTGQLHDCQERLRIAAMEQEASDLAEEMDRTLMPLLDVALMEPAIASLRIDRNRLLVRLYRRAGELFTDAQEEIPALGVRRGELIVNTAILQAEVSAAAALARAHSESPPRHES